MALDGGGNPVVSYTNRLSIFELKVLHCVDKSCTGEKATPTATVTPTTTPTITPTPPPAVGGIALDGEVRLLPLEYLESSNSFGLLAWAIAVFAFTLTIGGATWLTRKRLIG